MPRSHQRETPTRERKGRAGVEGGEEKGKKRKLREQALKSMLLARAKGSSVGDRCATHFHSLAPTFTSTKAPTQDRREKAGEVADDDVVLDVWEARESKKRKRPFWFNRRTGDVCVCVCVCVCVLIPD